VAAAVLLALALLLVVLAASVFFLSAPRGEKRERGSIGGPP
jgi:uncharacterized membrane protein (DUF373 family)